MRKRILSLLLCVCSVLLLLTVSASAAGFSDVKSDACYAKPVERAVAQGITTGKGTGTFAPNATCTRSQMVTFLYRCFVK